MGFTQGAKIVADILDEITTGLLASGVWHNVDTTWTTTDKTLNNARRSLAYGVAGAAGKGNTTLSSAISSGTTSVPVSNITNFAVNDKIVIGTGNIGEVRVVTGVNTTTSILTIDANVNSAHVLGDLVREIDLEIYMAIEVINQTNGQNYYYGAPWYYGKGFRFVFSASWDAVAHTYPTSNQSTFVPFETNYNYVVSIDLGPTPPPPATPTNPGLMVTYWLWIEDNGNGFVIMGRPEPTADSNQQSFIIVVERNPAKEYADGYTNFYLYKSTNIWQMLYDGDNMAGSNTIWRDRAILRPFAYQYPDGGGRIGSAPGGANGNGVSFIPMPSYYAFKSVGNNKVYFVKPLICDTVGQIAPIFQSNIFFLWSEGVGLIDGDVVSIEGTTTKFLCKAVDSPDSTNRLTYGIKYVA